MTYDVTINFLHVYVNAFNPSDALALAREELIDGGATWSFAYESEYATRVLKEL
jgi:hypothetical protein